MTVWRYLFLARETDIPERLIGADPEWYLRATLDEWAGVPDALDARAVDQYIRCFDAAGVHATCEDYRAGATIDLAHDRAEGSRTLDCPTCVLWSRRGLGQQYDVPGIWSRMTRHPHFSEVDCGHFLAEERPSEVAAELISFFAAKTTHTDADGAARDEAGIRSGPVREDRPAISRTGPRRGTTSNQ